MTTEELRDLYGYAHPPRAARDVREQGIPLRTFKVTGADGRKIAAYEFGDLSEIQDNKLGGRRVFSSRFKESLYRANNGKCDVCLERYEKRHLQVDHRIPYEVGGEVGGEDELGRYMLLCGSCNRAKSWSCEHCANWRSKKDASACRRCYWATPEGYEHIAMAPVRRLDLSWSGAQVAEFDEARNAAVEAGESLPDFVKEAIRKRVRGG